MEKKQFLNLYRDSVNRINSINDEIDELKEMATSISSRGIGSPAVRTSRNNSARFESYVDRIILLEDRLRFQIEQLEKTERDVTATIDKVEQENCAALLRYHYINGYTCEKAADKMGYSVDNIFKILRKAMNSFEVPEAYMNDSVEAASRTSEN